MLTAVATVGSTLALDAVATAGGLLLAASGLLSGFEHPLLLVALAITYVVWAAGMRVNLAANAALLARTATSTSILSKVAHDAARRAGAGDRARRLAASGGYVVTELAKEADERIRTFQADGARRAGIFHHLITLPTYHTAALSTDNLAKEYFGSEGMLGYVRDVQRQEIRQGIACVKHQNMAGSDIGDDHNEYFAGEAALKAGGTHNTMNQFG